MTQDFTAEQRNALRKIELLLRKAEGNANEHEASVATQLAQDLLAKYNLDMEAVGAGAGEEAAREKVVILGGSSEFERDLWRAVAELNWCWYFSITVYGDEARSSGTKKAGSSRAHRLIGKKVNILSTKLMASYLLTTIDALAKDYCLSRTGKYHNRSSMATSFRKGAAERLVGRLQAKRYEILEAEKRAEREARSHGDASGTALVMTRLSQSEYERNYDFTYGEGSYAKAMARQAKWAEEEKAREEREAKWRAENPEEAAKLDRKAEEKARKDHEKWERRQSRRSYRPVASDESAYYSGYDRARDIGLEKQVEEGKAPKRLN